MPNKSFTIRIPQDAPGITSDQVAGWLDTHLAAGGELAADPGAGERSLRLSLDREKVEQSAREAGEPEAVLLRRLIATHVTVPQEQREVAEPEARPKPLVLKVVARLIMSMFSTTTLGARRFMTSVAAMLKCSRSSSVNLAASAASVMCSTPNALRMSKDCPASTARTNGRTWSGRSLPGPLIAIEAEKIDRVHAIAELMRKKQAQPEPVLAAQGEVKPQ